MSDNLASATAHRGSVVGFYLSSALGAVFEAKFMLPWSFSEEAMQRSSSSIASLAAALAKAQAELVNPEKSLVATIRSETGRGAEPIESTIARNHTGSS